MLLPIATCTVYYFLSKKRLHPWIYTVGYLLKQFTLITIAQVVLHLGIKPATSFGVALPVPLTKPITGTVTRQWTLRTLKSETEIAKDLK